MKDVYIKANELSNYVGKHFKSKDLISVDDLIACIEELDYEIETLKEEKEDIEKERDEYYKPRYRTDYELYGVNESDFH